MASATHWRPTLFSGLRLRLTLLYLAVGLALVALVGVGTYRLLATYFETTTDLALEYTLVREIRLLGAPVPSDLEDAEETWTSRRDRWSGLNLFDRERSSGRRRRGSDDDHDDDRYVDPFDPDLAAVFVLPLGRTGNTLLPPDSVASVVEPDRQAAAAALQQGRDLRTTTGADGSRVRLLTYRLPDNAGPALLQVGRTLADQDRLLQQLVVGLCGLGGTSAVILGLGSWWLAGRALRPAQRAWDQQRTFVANASHELRTPLTLIRASTEVAMRGLAAADDRQALLNDVLQECDHMGRLVEDLLLLSRIDAGRLKLDRQPVPVADLLDDVRRQVGRLADQQDIHLEVSDRGGTVFADPTRLRQVLLILLDNALRHTPAGGTIRLDAQPHGRRVQFVVADTGEGIAPEHLPHVFERFYRAESTPSGERSGSGLGLAIAKALVEAQRGQIQIASHPGQGTRVTLILPADEG